MSLSCDAGGMEGWSSRGMAERGSLGAGSRGEEQRRGGNSQERKQGLEIALGETGGAGGREE